MSYRPASNHPPSRPDRLLLSFASNCESGPDLTSLRGHYNPVPKPSRIESSYSTKSIPESYTSLSCRSRACIAVPTAARACRWSQSPPVREGEAADFWDDAIGEDDFINVSVVPATIPLGQPIRTLRQSQRPIQRRERTDECSINVHDHPSGYSQTPQHQSALTADMEDGNA
ncbi:hypothetical protein Hypma_005240 [Hypsizygus marmoreus]|uniref:Uncharacterized protein n=1 Tax=Hypsizygus marmoreus TaxID=39966 RepID=A0A369IZC8_HYPMA|nr:hypothetical protein Hypma_005240 [Hypsizygus marmoreus]